jgi:hypothetical protein
VHQRKALAESHRVDRQAVLVESMSLDGFITGPDDDVGQGLGRGGERLHDWLGDGHGGFRPSGPSGEIFDELEPQVEAHAPPPEVRST